MRPARTLIAAIALAAGLAVPAPQVYAHMTCRAGGICYDVTAYQMCWTHGGVDPLGCFSDADASPLCPLHLNLTVIADYPIVPCGGTACIVKGVTIPDGDTRPYFKAKKNGACLSHARTCSNGTLGPPNGGFDFPTCNGCDLDGVVLDNGESHTAYSAPDPITGLCTQETRTCNNGDLTGTLEFSTCAPVSPPEPCNKAGLITWRSSKNRVEWCDGTNWKNPSLSVGASCTGTTPGKISFVSGVLQYCNGTNWVSMKGALLGNCADKPGTFKYVPASNNYVYCDGSQKWKMGN